MDIEKFVITTLSWVIAVTVFSFITMMVWNLGVAPINGLPEITFSHSFVVYSVSFFISHIIVSTVKSFLGTK